MAQSLKYLLSGPLLTPGYSKEVFSGTGNSDFLTEMPTVQPSGCENTGARTWTMFYQQEISPGKLFTTPLQHIGIYMLQQHRNKVDNLTIQI